jgi:hypothetical protein
MDLERRVLRQAKAEIIEHRTWQHLDGGKRGEASVGSANADDLD